MAYRVGSVTSFTTGAQNTTTFVINSPVGVSLNDIIIIGVFSGTNGSQTCTSPGFTVGDTLTQATSISQGPHCALTWLYKVATGSEPSTYTVTYSGAPFNDTEAFCAAWTGRNTATPITANSQVKTAGSGSPFTFSLTGVTAAAGDDLLGLAICVESATCAWTPPSGFTTGVALQSATPFGNAYLCYKDSVSAGATGLVQPVETGVGTDNIGFVISLAQSSGVVAPPAPMYHRKNVLYFI